jgi:hypothetical protein
VWFLFIRYKKITESKNIGSKTAADKKAIFGSAMTKQSAVEVEGSSADVDVFKTIKQSTSSSGSKNKEEKTSSSSSSSDKKDKKKRKKTQEQTNKDSEVDKRESKKQKKDKK